MFPEVGYDIQSFVKGHIMHLDTCVESAEFSEVWPARSVLLHTEP